MCGAPRPSGVSTQSHAGPSAVSGLTVPTVLVWWRRAEGVHRAGWTEVPCLLLMARDPRASLASSSEPHSSPEPQACPGLSPGAGRASRADPARTSGVVTRVSDVIDRPVGAAGRRQGSRSEARDWSQGTIAHCHHWLCDHVSELVF